MHDLPVEVALLAERFHDELLEIFREEREAILVGQHDHVFFPAPIAGKVPREREEHRGIFQRLAAARPGIHRRRAIEHALHVEPLLP